jgi:aspartyl-tRNA(Asn)/glutamyl-tRNA(Gln) amidotransferase subunit A
MAEIWQMTAVDLAAAIRTRKLSSREVMDAVLARIEALDGQTHAFATVDAQGARRAADAADRAVAAGEPLGPLHGLPVSAKDLIATAGLRTAQGSRLYADHVPTADAEVIRRVRAAGGIVFGKTTTPEFGCKIVTDSPLHGPTRNPWDLERTPGGSSGGAAAAVAMGFGPLALTTDGAGSSRVPAACCGIVGLKPTLGGVPMELAADMFGGLSCIGTMARTAADIRLLFDAIAGPCRLDPWTLHAGERRAAAPARGFDGLRVRHFRRMGNPGLDPEVGRLTDAMVSWMAQAGAQVQAGPDDLDWSLDACRILLRANQAARNGHLLAGKRDLMDPIAVQCLEEGLGLSLAQVNAALLERTALFRRVQALFEDADVLVMPAFGAPPLAVTHAADQPLAVGDAPPLPLRTSWYSYAIPFNPSGHPAISVPCGLAANGLPVGLQIVAPWHREDLLIGLAQVLETQFRWTDRWPPAARRPT